MQKPPVGFRGDTGIGALTGLSGVGQQDPFLYDFDSKREYNYSEYSQATPYYRFYRPATNTFLGEEIRYTFRPQDMGDLLTGLMLKFNFPSSTGTPTCLKNLGLSMIKKIDFILNGKTIQTLRGEWLSIYESMYSTEQDRQNIFNVSFNLGATYNTRPVLKANDTSQRLFFPLPFFFNNHYVDSKADTTSFRASLPLCAMHNTEIILAIQFLPLADIVSDTSGFAADADLTDFMFVTEEVTLTQSERFMLRSTRQEYPVEKVTAEETEVAAAVDTYFRYFFNSAYSCRAIFWTFKNNITGYNPFFYNPLIDARITTLNKTDRNELRKPLFLQQLQAYIHDYYNDGSFYGYSFSEQPLQVVIGDYEFRAPRPQSAYIDMFFTAAAPGYTLWSRTFGAATNNYTITNAKYLLDTSVGLDRTTNALLTLDMSTDGYLRTNTARVGIPATSYTGTDNLSNPYMMRFEPWVNRKITISATDYFPSPNKHYVDSTGTYQDGSFTYLTADDVNVPYWKNGTTDAVLIHQDGTGAPIWGIYTGDVSLLTAGVSSVTGSFSNIAVSFTLGTDYPTDVGTTFTSPTGYIKIVPSARTNINTFVATIDSYLLTTYYLSTNTLMVENGSADVIDYDVGNGVVEGKFNRLDADGSGFIEAIEFDVSTYDRDGDGKVSFAEFKEIEEV